MGGTNPHLLLNSLGNGKIFASYSDFLIKDVTFFSIIYMSELNVLEYQMLLAVCRCGSGRLSREFHALWFFCEMGCNGICDHKALFGSIWVNLNHRYFENVCLHCIPAFHDLNYCIMMPIYSFHYLDISVMEVLFPSIVSCLKWISGDIMDVLIMLIFSL